MNDCTIIIFGATGDLAKRKIIPALYGLMQDGKLKNFAIIGAALTDTDAAGMLEQAKNYIDDVDQNICRAFAQRVSYVQLNFSTPEGFDRLAQIVAQVEKKQKLSGNRLIYCAVASTFFVQLTQQLARVALIKKGADGVRGGIWQRVVYEKPFGTDLISAQAINRSIAQVLTESQIFRVDHYLAKELVADIALVRFTNRVFEPLWSKAHIENVQIVLSETSGVQGRGHYYDGYGAMRDVVQNHMLQLIALVAIEAPEKLSGNFIRDKKADILQHIRPGGGILGQYQGYSQEAGIKPDSITETFAALQLYVDNERWSGVPFYLRTGKCLNKRETTIYIRFKPVTCLMTTGCPSEPNFLIIRISPDEGFSLELNAKKPGIFDQLIPVTMNYCHDCTYAPRTPHAYELVLQEVLKGEQAVSVRFDEIEYAWRVVDQLYAMHLPLYEYKKNSKGPSELEAFGMARNIRWRE